MKKTAKGSAKKAAKGSAKKVAMKKPGNLSAKKASVKKVVVSKAAVKKSPVKNASAGKAPAKGAATASAVAIVDAGAPANADAIAQSNSSGDNLIGKMIPNFSLDSTTGNKTSTQNLNGKIAVLYFYPKDNTPGCTLEGHDFRRLHKEFQKAGAEIFGVSRDSIKSHQKFAGDCGFPFELLSDPNDELMRALEVIQMKKNYGREYEGIVRSTFVVDASGKIRNVWRNVKVSGHADAVLAAVKSI